MTEQRRPAAGASSAVAEKDLIIDCDAHNVPLPQAVAAYLSQRWRDYFGLIGLRTPDANGLVRARLGASDRCLVTALGTPRAQTLDSSASSTSTDGTSMP